VGKSIYAPLVTDKFHVYTMGWDKRQIRSYIDGVHYFTFDKRAGVDAWPFDQPFHLLLNLAIGGELSGIKGVDDTLFPHHFDIDYVRIYQKE
jgi:beta-glucanase (GH16 family)